jgi:peptidoglycan hydrolase-like protein with peptidoglycan-binding domain
MIRVLLPLITMLGGVPVLRAQTRSFQIHPFAESVDGSLGPETETAIQSYQLAHHQPVTGLLDRALLSQLDVVTPSR